MAAHYIATEFARLRVPALKRSYYQNFSFPVNTFPNDIHFRINGKELVLGQDFLPDEASGSFKGVWNYRKIDVTEWMDIPTLKPIVDSITKGYYNSVILENENFKGDTLNIFYEVKQLFHSLANVLIVTQQKMNFSVATEQLPHAAFIVQKSALPENILTIDSDIEPVFKKEHLTQNVIAVVKAKKKANKAPYLFFTAHYDHLGKIGSQVYFPGASDNASGVSMLMSLAKYFKENPSNYNIVFIAFAGEEAGLIGSKYYVENPLLPLNKIKFLVNLDLMGNGEDGITVVNGSVFQKEFNLLTQINEEKQGLTTIKSRGKAANSDHYFFTEAGVPSIFIYTMGKNLNYHDIYDKYEDLSFAKFQEIIQLLIDFIQKI